MRFWFKILPLVCASCMTAADLKPRNHAVAKEAGPDAATVDRQQAELRRAWLSKQQHAEEVVAQALRRRGDARSVVADLSIGVNRDKATLDNDEARLRALEYEQRINTPDPNTIPRVTLRGRATYHGPHGELGIKVITYARVGNWHGELVEPNFVLIDPQPADVDSESIVQTTVHVLGYSKTRTPFGDELSVVLVSHAPPVVKDAAKSEREAKKHSDLIAQIRLRIAPLQGNSSRYPTFRAPFASVTIQPSSPEVRPRHAFCIAAN